MKRNSLPHLAVTCIDNENLTSLNMVLRKVLDLFVKKESQHGEFMREFPNVDQETNNIPGQERTV
jgi:hypothetical protein